MSKIKEIREAMDTKLDQLEARTTAAQTLLQPTKRQALEQCEALKKGLGDTLEEFESELAKARATTNENMQEIHTRFDHLRVQLALGKAEGRDSFEAQKKRIHHSINALEATVGKELEASGPAIQESLRNAANKFIAAAVKLDAEMEFLAIQFQVTKDNSWDRFTHEKRALILQINRYKDKLQA
jgi:autotransporter translocation and assembly factor TamB